MVPRRTRAILPSILPFPKAGDLMKHFLSAAILSFAVATSAGQVAANGNHYGWCNGVGNPHGGTNCGGGTGTAQPSQLPANVPTSNQKPSKGPANPQTPGALPTQAIVVTPQPGQTIVGTGPVTTIVGQPGPSFKGTGKPTIILRPLPPQVFTGVSPAKINPQKTPSFVGFSLPTVTIIPNPPQTFTGYGKVPATIIVQPVDQTSISGTGPVPFPVPQQIPQQIPTAVPSKIPQGTPYLIPSLKSNQVPAKTSVAVPPKAPQAIPMLLPRPKPRPNTQKPIAIGGPTSHKPVATEPALKQAHITRFSGRQEQHNLPEFDAADGGQPWRCVASGHGQRKSLSDRRVSTSGTLRHVGSIDVLGRDLPALHPQHANCIISLKRRTN